eukprot:g11020.t1
MEEGEGDPATVAGEEVVVVEELEEEVVPCPLAAGDEAPYKCAVCDASFARLAGLLAHQRGHTAEQRLVQAEAEVTCPVPAPLPPPPPPPPP